MQFPTTNYNYTSSPNHILHNFKAAKISDHPYPGIDPGSTGLLGQRASTPPLSLLQEKGPKLATKL